MYVTEGKHREFHLGWNVTTMYIVLTWSQGCKMINDIHMKQ